MQNGLTQSSISEIGRKLYQNRNGPLESQVSILKQLFNDDYKNTMAALQSSAPGSSSQVSNSDKLYEYELDAGDKFAKMCGVQQFNDPKAPVTASVCANLITKCVKGDSSCLGSFEELALQINKNGIDAKDLRNSEVLKNLLKNLRINVNDELPIHAWLKNLTSEAKGDVVQLQAINKIANNPPLLKILNEFIVVARNPVVVAGTPAHVEAVGNLSIFKFLRPRPSTPKPYNISNLKNRVERKPIGHINQSGGGDELDNKDSRFFDYLKNQFLMTGGNHTDSYQLNAPHLKATYDEYKRDLASKGKQVEAKDNTYIEGLLSDFAKKESELNEVIWTVNKARLVKDNSELNNATNITLKMLKGSLENKHTSVVGEYNTKGLTIVDILKCIRDGCNNENFNLWRNADKLKAEARMEDVRDLFNITHPLVNAPGRKGDSVTSSVVPAKHAVHSETSELNWKDGSKNKYFFW